MYVKDQLGYKKRLRRRAKRPSFLSAVCIVLVLLGFWSIISSYMGIYPGFGTLYPAANALMVVFSFVAISGVWSMEKWGPISFVIVVVLKLLTDAAFGHFNPFYLLAFLPAALFFVYYPKMKKTD